MSKKSKQQLKLDNASTFPNNNNGYITPERIRVFHNDVIDSLLDENTYKIDQDNIQQSLSTEISNRISADNNLTTSISFETSERILNDNSLNTILSTEISNRISADKLLSTEITTYQKKLDNDLNTSSKYVVDAINEINLIAKNGQQALVFDDYNDLTSFLLTASTDNVKIGQTIYIKTVNVADVWISVINLNSVDYTFIDDETFTIDILNNNGQIGYFNLSKMETGKVNLENYVPYTGATKDVDLQDFVLNSQGSEYGENILVDGNTISFKENFYIQSKNGVKTIMTDDLDENNLSINPYNEYQQVDVNGDIINNNTIATKGIKLDVNEPYIISNPGEIGWNASQGTFDMHLLNNTILQAGQELHIYAKAVGDISNGDVVQLIGSQGGHLTIKKAVQSEIITNPNLIIGVSTENILNGNFGYVTNFGEINGVYTSGYTEGDSLYFNITGSTAGTFTNVKPNAPYPIIRLGSVLRAQTGNAENGKIGIRLTYSTKLQDLSDVNGTPLTTSGQILVWNNTTSTHDFTDNINNYSTISNSDAKYALQDGTVLYHSKPWFVPNSNQTITVSANGLSVTISNPVGNFQFYSTMVKAKLTINGISRIIGSYASSSVIGLSSAFPSYMFNQTYPYTTWNVTSRSYQAYDSDSLWSNVYYDYTGGVTIYTDVNNNYIVNSTYNIFKNGEFNIIGLQNYGYFGLSLGSRIVATDSVGSGYQNTPDIGLIREKPGMWSIYDGVTGSNYRDLKLRNIYSYGNLLDTYGNNKYVAQNGGNTFHTQPWINTGTISSNGTTITGVGTSFTSFMVGAKIIVNGEERIISTYISPTSITINSSYSQNYSGVSFAVYCYVSKVQWTGGEYCPIFYTHIGGEYFLKSYDRIIFGAKISNGQNDGHLNFNDLNAIKLAGNHNIIWSSQNATGNANNATADTGIKRESAGLLSIYDGVTSTNYRDLKLRNIILANSLANQYYTIKNTTTDVNNLFLDIVPTTTSPNYQQTVSIKGQNARLTVENTNDPLTCSFVPTYGKFQFQANGNYVFFVHPSGVVASTIPTTNASNTPRNYLDDGSGNMIVSNKIGIGTSIPAYKLEINNTGSNATGFAFNIIGDNGSTNGSRAGFKLTDITTSTGGFSFISRNNNFEMNQEFAPYANLWKVSSTGNLTVLGNITTIGSGITNLSGTVGIGVASPSSTLHVNGTGRFGTGSNYTQLTYSQLECWVNDIISSRFSGTEFSFSDANANIAGGDITRFYVNDITNSFSSIITASNCAFYDNNNSKYSQVTLNGNVIGDDNNSIYIGFNYGGFYINDGSNQKVVYLSTGGLTISDNINLLTGTYTNSLMNIYDENYGTLVNFERGNCYLSEPMSFNFYTGGSVEINSTGFLFSGDATFFDDLQGDITKTKTVGTRVTLNEAENTIDFTNTSTLSDYVFLNFQMSHKWKIGSIVYPHIHWEQTLSTTPNWLIQYRWQKQGGPKTTAWTNYKCNVNVFTYTSGTLNQISQNEGITPPVDAGISDIIEIRVIRDTANASGLFTPGNTYAATASITSIDLHYECSQLGSNTLYS